VSGGKNASVFYAGDFYMSFMNIIVWESEGVRHFISVTEILMNVNTVGCEINVQYSLVQQLIVFV
jgi:hypothetical protein